MFHHDKTEVTIKESHKHRHDKMSYEVKEKHHDGGNCAFAGPIVPGAGMGMGIGMGTVIPPVPVPSAPMGKHDKFSLKIKEKMHGSKRPVTTTTTTTTAIPMGVATQVMGTAPFGTSPVQLGGIVGGPTENTYVYEDPPVYISPDMPPVTTTYIVHEPVMPAMAPLPVPLAPTPVIPAATVTGKHELKVKEKIRGRGAVASPPPAPLPVLGGEFGAPLIPPPTLGKHDKFQFRLKEKHRG